MPAAAYTQGVDPRRWIIERIRAQAEAEDVTFKVFEQQYLALTEQGDDESAMKMLDALEPEQYREIDDRIGGLLLRRYESDTHSNDDAKQEYKAAFENLNEVEKCDNLTMFVNEILLKNLQQELKPQLLRLLLAVVAVIALVLIAMVIWRR